MRNGAASNRCYRRAWLAPTHVANLVFWTFQMLWLSLSSLTRVLLFVLGLGTLDDKQQAGHESREHCLGGLQVSRSSSSSGGLCGASVGGSTPDSSSPQHQRQQHSHHPAPLPCGVSGVGGVQQVVISWPGYGILFFWSLGG